MRRYWTIMLAVVLCFGLIAPAGRTAQAAGGPVVGSYSRVYYYSYLRMRSGPGYNYSVKMNMNRGEIVRILSGPTNGEWYKVQYRGVTGYAIRGGLTHTGLAGTSIAKSYYRVVVVSLARQQVEAYQNGRLALISVATSRPTRQEHKQGLV